MESGEWRVESFSRAPKGSALFRLAAASTRRERSVRTNKNERGERASNAPALRGGNACAPALRRVDAAAKLTAPLPCGARLNDALPCGARLNDARLNHSSAPSTIHHPLSTIHSTLSPLLSPLSPLLLLVLLAGCSRGIDTIYGQREGLGAKRSVNGTAVLGEMFEQAGHRVSSWSVLSPRLQEKADCIVWFPDDFKPPKEKVRHWLNGWMTARPGRTLIYVGRDFDAAPWYWQHVLPGAPKEQRELIEEELAGAQSSFAVERGSLPKSENCGWFAIDSSPSLRRVKKLAGDAAWLDGIDAAKTDIQLRSRITPPAAAEVLLRSGKDVLVSRRPYEESQLIVVANGSFLLNLPLVNHEHRKLAGKLIEAVGSPRKTVVFLESNPGGPPIRDKDPTAEGVNSWEVFNRPPTNWILLHLAAVGIIFCFCRWPIFGRAKKTETTSDSDFARHVNALADLLQRSRDRAYAMERILNYRQRTERDK